MVVPPAVSHMTMNCPVISVSAHRTGRSRGAGRGGAGENVEAWELDKENP